MYSQLRRSAANRRASMAMPGAGGVSALALLAATTLPGLVGGRAGGRERIAYRADATDSHAASPSHATSGPQAAGAPMDGLVVDPSLAARASSSLVPPRVAATRPPTSAAEHARIVAPTAVAHPEHARTPSPHPARTTTTAAAPRHIALAHDAANHHTRRSVAHALNGGAAPAAPRISVAAPRVPAVPQPPGHPSTGGGSIEAESHTQASVESHPVASTKPVEATHPVASTKPVEATHPVAPTKPVEATHPVTATKPVTAIQPVSATKPAPKPTAPAPPPPATGGYVNPLAGASVTPERIDQGVDYGGSGTLGAIGDGKITYVGTSGTGWPGAFVEFQLTSGADAGRYVYYAESISPAAGLHVGQAVHAGQPIASINGQIEVGWGSGVGTQPAAQANGQWGSGSDAGNVATPDGKSFSALIASLGGPAGKVEG